MVESVTATFVTREASTAAKVAGDTPGWELAEWTLHDLGAVRARDQMTSRATF